MIYFFRNPEKINGRKILISSFSCGAHVVGGVGSVTKIHVNNVRNQGNY